MRTFLIGFVAGAATYHYISGGFNNDELIAEVRTAIRSLDDKLAEKNEEKNTSVTPPSVASDEDVTPTEETSS